MFWWIDGHAFSEKDHIQFPSASRAAGIGVGSDHTA
jgi:hypothetical protein